MSPPDLGADPPLVIGCGALVRELRAVLPEHTETRFLPAVWHNDPDRIVAALRDELATVDPERTVLVGYGDCGTGGGLDRLLAERPNTVRLPGPHCYAFLTGGSVFDRLAADELGTFFLTDFLARHFDALVWRAYRLDTNPELVPVLFAHYTRVVHLAQTDDPTVAAAARSAAERLGLALEQTRTGLGPLRREVAVAIAAGRPRVGAEPA